MNVFGRKWKIYIVNPRIEGVLIGADPTSNSTIYDTRLVTDEALLLESPLHMTATVKYITYLGILLIGLKLITPYYFTLGMSRIVNYLYCS